ncbi:MAG: hypothetical protein LBB81_01315 [Treponema sp.]|jgi:hypothetical protein|nr:hypothetical protein [Treponema sp.]
MPQFDSVDYTASWTQICNRALGRLGSDTITDLADGTKSAEYCGRFLPEAIEHILGQWDFKFARRRMRLTPNDERPIFGWKNQFNYPMDCIRLVRVYGGHNEKPEESEYVPYQVENGKILCDANTLQIIYIARPDDPNQLPQSVRKAISTHLAYLLSTPLTSNEQLTGLIAAESQTAIELAKKVDAQMNFDPDAKGNNYHTEERI